jgi:hypothetical protein
MLGSILFDASEQRCDKRSKQQFDFFYTYLFIFMTVDLRFKLRKGHDHPENTSPSDFPPTSPYPSLSQARGSVDDEGYKNEENM